MILFLLMYMLDTAERFHLKLIITQLKVAFVAASSLKYKEKNETAYLKKNKVLF